MTTKKELEKQRSRIRDLAARINMRYAGGQDVTTDIELAVGQSWTPIADKVESVLCSLSNPQCTVLNVRMGKESSIPLHQHPLRREDIFVIDGSIKDTHNDLEFSRGERYTIPAKTYHQIESDHALLTIVFRPAYPEINLNDDDNIKAE